MRSGQGNPDEARAARYVLKDYVAGKLLFCHAPPGVPEDEFNAPTHKRSLARVAGKKLAPTTRVGKNSDTFVLPESATVEGGVLRAKGLGHKSQLIDQDFFTGEAGLRDRPMFQNSGQEFSRVKAYPHQFTVLNDGTRVLSQQAYLRNLMKQESGKKHKKPKRTKQRSGKGYD